MCGLNILGMGFCVRKQAICARDLSGMSGKFRLGFQSLQFRDEEVVGQSVLHISLTSQCMERYLPSFPPLAGRKIEAQGMPYVQKAGSLEQKTNIL